MDSDDRLLPDLTNIGNTNSVTKCRELCSSKGFAYMGVQATTWCACGHDPPPLASKVAQDDCNHICPGNNEEKCGASWRMNVYHETSGTGRVKK